MVIVVQQVRTSDCGSESRGFESHHSPKQGPVPKWFKGVLCKSIIRQFESDRDLNITLSYNGSTSGFGPLNRGSSPWGVTKFFWYKYCPFKNPDLYLYHWKENKFFDILEQKNADVMEW